MITPEHIPAITHLVALHQTTPHHSPIHTSTHSVSPKLPHEISTVNPRMMDHSRCVSKGTLTYSTVPSWLCIYPYRAPMPLYRSHAMPIRLDMRCTSHQTVTPIRSPEYTSPQASYTTLQSHGSATRLHFQGRQRRLHRYHWALRLSTWA